MTGPADPDFEARVRSSFARQRFMETLGARLTLVEAGEIHIELSHREALTQQHGFVHAGALASIADSACGYAALSVMPAGVAVLSVEFKINLMKPATGTRFRAIGKVVRAGRTLTVCSGDVLAFDQGRESKIALMQATMMAVRDHEGLAD